MAQYQLKLADSKIFAAVDEGEFIVVRARVECSREIEHHYLEKVTVSVVFFDTNLSIDQIEKQAIQKAKELIKEVAASLE